MPFLVGVPAAQQFTALRSIPLEEVLLVDLGRRHLHPRGRPAPCAALLPALCGGAGCCLPGAMPLLPLPAFHILPYSGTLPTDLDARLSSDRWPGWQGSFHGPIVPLHSPPRCLLRGRPGCWLPGTRPCSSSQSILPADLALLIGTWMPAQARVVVTRSTWPPAGPVSCFEELTAAFQVPCLSLPTPCLSSEPGFMHPLLGGQAWTSQSVQVG